MIPVPEPRKLEPLLDRVAPRLRQLARFHVCSGLAISFCGIVDAACRILSTPAGKYDDARDLDLPAWCRRELDLPLYMENDARMALLGERFAGAGVGYDDLVMVTLGTGIGAAAMISGRLLRGKHSQAGCLGGHLPAHFEGRACRCGAIGCVEAEASGWALTEICRSRPGFNQSRLASTEINFAQVFSLALSGDVVAREVRDRCIRVWAAGIIGLIHAYDPEIVVLGGAVMGSAMDILPPVREHVRKHSWTPWGEVKIEAAALGNAAALLGATPLVANRC